MSLRVNSRTALRFFVSLHAFSVLALLQSGIALAALEECLDIPVVTPIMATNGSSNELLWVRPDQPDVCVTSDDVNSRSQLRSLGFLSCKTYVTDVFDASCTADSADEDGSCRRYNVIATDTNRGQVLSYFRGKG